MDLFDAAKEISKSKNEPEWMLKIRLKAAEKFSELEGSIDINLDEILLYQKGEGAKATWDEVPGYIKEIFERLGIPEAERKILAGVSLQYNSEVAYERLKDVYSKEGIIFETMENAVKKYPSLLKKYFKSRKYDKLGYLNTAVWSGGNFIYVPRGVEVKRPIQAFFTVYKEGLGHFPRTLIVVEEGASLKYIEGCTAPTYSKMSLHSAMFEAFIKGSFEWVNVQNWSKNMLTLDRSYVYVDNGSLSIVSGNLGSKKVEKVPKIYLNNSNLTALSVSYAKEQHFITGFSLNIKGKSSFNIKSKAIIDDKGISDFKLKANINAKGNGYVDCETVMVGRGKSLTYPFIKNLSEEFNVSHEAKVNSFSTDSLFYLSTRGLNEEEALSLLTTNFLSEFAKKVPIDFAVEFNKLLDLKVRGIG